MIGGAVGKIDGFIGLRELYGLRCLGLRQPTVALGFAACCENSHQLAGFEKAAAGCRSPGIKMSGRNRTSLATVLHSLGLSVRVPFQCEEEFRLLKKFLRRFRF